MTGIPVSRINQIIWAKSFATVGIWGFAYLGKRNENNMLIQLAKAKSDPQKVNHGNYYGYALVATLVFWL